MQNLSTTSLNRHTTFLNRQFSTWNSMPFAFVCCHLCTFVLLLACLLHCGANLLRMICDFYFYCCRCHTSLWNAWQKNFVTKYYWRVTFSKNENSHQVAWKSHGSHLVVTKECEVVKKSGHSHHGAVLCSRRRRDVDEGLFWARSPSPSDMRARDPFVTPSRAQDVKGSAIQPRCCYHGPNGR